MAGKPDREVILEFLAGRPDGAQLNEIAAAIGKSTGITSSVLTVLHGVGWVENPEKGIWRCTDSGLNRVGVRMKAPAAASEAGEIMKPGVKVEEVPATSVPGEYEKFAQIGRSLGIKEDFLKVLSDHVFLGDVHDLNYVWDTLNGVYLRPDVTRRYFNIWSRVINQPIPAEIAAQIMPPTTQAAKEAEAKTPTKFTLIGDEIVPDPEGEFTFSQARQVLMTKAIQGAAPQLGGEKVSEIIGAISPFLQESRAARAEEIREQGEQSVLATVVKSLIESKGGNAQQALTLADMLTVVDKIDEARRSAQAAIAAGNTRQPTGFEEVERIVNVIDKLKGLFGSGSAASPVTVAIKGVNGETGAVPLETFFSIQDHQRKIRQEDEELEGKREMGKSIRGFLDKISRAAGNIK